MMQTRYGKWQTTITVGEQLGEEIQRRVAESDKSEAEIIRNGLKEAYQND